MTALPRPSLRHLARLTDAFGIVEHARGADPRPDLGYCTDDAGRLLAVACRLPADPDAERLASTALRFLEVAHAGDGHFRLRADIDGNWTDDRPSDDASGRALYGLGVAARDAPWAVVRSRSATLFDAAAGFRSPHPRAMAVAALGAVARLAAAPCTGAAALLVDAHATLPRPAADPRWRWPAPRLTYANALLPEALLAVGTQLDDEEAVQEGLALLDWLVRTESRRRWFSFTPVTGRGPHDAAPAFDQQPIEAWAMADAAARAEAATGNPRWRAVLHRAARWFTGSNDTGAVVFDEATGGGYDALTAGGVNRNEGAESTLAFVATMARAAEVLAVDRRPLAMAPDGGGR